MITTPFIPNQEVDSASLAAGFENGFKDFGEVYLSNYKLAVGPEFIPRFP
jgi:hypothetical protein